MRTIAIIALAALFATSSVDALSPKWHQLDGYTWAHYKNDFGRRYASPVEAARRQRVFEDRLDRIRAHNADLSASYRKGVNQFSDWTEEEFRSYNRATAKPKAGLVGDGPIPLNTLNAVGASVPFQVDYRRTTPAVLTGVKNQGACGSCWAHSTVESIESFFAIKFGQLPVLSTQQVTACTTTVDGCGGGDYFSGWQYISGSTGLNEEWVYPYTEFFVVNETQQATAQCLNITAQWLPNFPWVPKANVSAMWMVDPNNATAAVEGLALHGPLSIAVGAADWSEYETGVFFNNPLTNTSWEIDHAVQLVGYGFDDDVRVPYWIVRNSWGTSWGEAGFIRLYRSEDPSKEPCGPAGAPAADLACGTSGVLSNPAFPEVSLLTQQNV